MAPQFVKRNLLRKLFGFHGKGLDTFNCQASMSSQAEMHRPPQTKPSIQAPHFHSYESASDVIHLHQPRKRIVCFLAVSLAGWWVEHRPHILRTMPQYYRIPMWRFSIRQEQRRIVTTPFECMPPQMFFVLRALQQAPSPSAQQNELCVIVNDICLPHEPIGCEYTFDSVTSE